MKERQSSEGQGHVVFVDFLADSFMALLNGILWVERAPKNEGARARARDPHGRPTGAVVAKQAGTGLRHVRGPRVRTWSARAVLTNHASSRARRICKCVVQIGGAWGREAKNRYGAARNGVSLSTKHGDTDSSGPVADGFSHHRAGCMPLACETLGSYLILLLLLLVKGLYNSLCPQGVVVLMTTKLISVRPNHGQKKKKNTKNRLDVYR